MKRCLSFVLLLFTFVCTQAQNEWIQHTERGKAFIENRGQFDTYATSECGKVLYALDEGTTKVLFCERGIVYYFLQASKVPKAIRDSIRRIINNTPTNGKDQWQRVVGKFLYKSDKVWMQWQGGSNATIEAGEKQSDTHSYTYYKDGQYVNTNQIGAFTSIRYKNLYPGVDVQVRIHPEGGFKYDYILQAGIDLSIIKTNYSRDIQITNDVMHLPTLFGDILEHKPLAYYAAADSRNIPISFNTSNHRDVVFNSVGYDSNQSVVIDPWVQTPNFNTTWKCVWECERDAAGNVYIIGGIMPMQVLKYNSGGTLQWTYNTPYDTSNTWLGTFATDNAGNSYITAGSTAQIQKINTAAALQWNNTNPGGLFTGAEFWSIAFNCDQTKMMVGGTGGIAIALTAAVFDVNMNTGAVISTQDYAQGAMFSIPPNIQEIRSICSTPKNKFYFLTQDTIGGFHQNFSLCNNNNGLLFKNTSTYNFSYKCENYRYDNTGICAMKANEDFLYTQNGTQVHKRSLQNGAILATANIPGGGNTVTLGENQVHNSGIDIDDCGNVYVGSTNAVIKYDANLNQLASYPTLFRVYDVIVTNTGEIIAAGSTGTSSTANRTGYVQVINASACEPMSIVCCDPTICPVNNLCTTDGTQQLIASTPGGTWSGTGVSVTGIFNPALAGAGVHTIIYTLACGADSITITVSPCQNLTACVELNGTVTVSNGLAPYTWQYFQPASSTPITNQTECTACGYTWFFGTCLNGIVPVTTCNTPAQWVTFATGINATVPGSVSSFQITDNGGTTTSFTTATIAPCTTCPVITVAITNQINCTCSGGNDGSVTVAANGGTGPYSYLWSTNATTAQINNLTAGNYTVTATDANGCTGTLQVNISEPAVSLPGVSFDLVNTTLCLTDDITINNTNIETNVNYTWYISNWAPILNDLSVTISGAALGLGAHEVMLSGMGVCGSNSVSATITVIDCTVPEPIADFSASNTSICNGDCISFTNNSTYEPGASFSWNFGSGNPANSNSSNPGQVCFASAGNTLVQLIVTNPGGQADTSSLTITVNNCTLPPPVADFTISNSSLCVGGCIILTNNSTYSAGATFAWSFAGGSPANDNSAQPPAICYATVGTFAVQLIVTNTDGQADTLIQTIAVDNCVAPPVASFMVSNTSICTADCISLTNLSTFSVNAIQQWTISGGTPASYSGATPPDVCYSVAGTYTIKLVISDNGQSDSTTIDITVTDCALPVALFSTSTTNICVGESVVFTNQSSNATTYQWTFNGGSPASDNTATPPTITYNTAGQFIALLTVTDGLGHDSTYFMIINVSPCIYPIANLSGNGSSICAGECVQYNDGSVNAEAWMWFFPGGVPSFSMQQIPPTVCYPTGGVYAVTLIVSNAYGNDTITINNGVIVYNPTPVSLTFNTVTLTTGESVQIVAGGGISYQWTPPTGLSSDTIPNPIASPGDTTVYTVVMTDIHGCTSTATVTINVHPPFVVFVPNSFSPNADGVNDYLQIYSTVTLNELEFYIYDRWGTQVFSSYMYGEKWDGTFRGKPCNTGVYVYYYHARFTDGSQISGHGDINLLR